MKRMWHRTWCLQELQNTDIQHINQQRHLIINWNKLHSTWGLNCLAINASSGVILCACRLPENGTRVSKLVGAIHIKNCVLLFVFYCILLSGVVCRYIEDTKMGHMSNITFAGYGQSDQEVRECVLDKVKRESLIKCTQTCRQTGNSLVECRITAYRPRKYISVGWKLLRWQETVTGRRKYT